MSPQNDFFRRRCCQFVGNLRPGDRLPASKEQQQRRSGFHSGNHPVGSLARDGAQPALINSRENNRPARATSTILRLTRPCRAVRARLFVHRPAKKTQIAILAPERPQANRGQKNRLQDTLRSGSMDAVALTLRAMNRHENSPHGRGLPIENCRTERATCWEEQSL